MNQLKYLSLVMLSLLSVACGTGSQSVGVPGQPVYPGGNVNGQCLARLDQPIQFTVPGTLMNAVRLEAGRIGPQNRISPNVSRGNVQLGVGTVQQSPWSKTAYGNAMLTLSVLLQDPNAYMAMAQSNTTIQTTLQGSLVLGTQVLQSLAQTYGGQLPCVINVGFFVNHTPMAIVGQHQPVDFGVGRGQALVYLYLNADPNNPIELLF
jgi:hypothetical protein